MKYNLITGRKNIPTLSQIFNLNYKDNAKFKSFIKFEFEKLYHLISQIEKTSSSNFSKRINDAVIRMRLTFHEKYCYCE